MISQYANSPKFVKLVEGMRSAFNEAQTIEDWFNIVYNLKTASGFGLDVWGLILNQSRLLYYTDEGVEKTVYLKGSQTVGGEDYTAEQIEEYYRMLLFFKAFSYITNSTVKSFNDLLRFYFPPEKLVYVQEIGTMAIELNFEFFPTTLERIIFASELFPKPAGVGLRFRFIPKGAWFGFFDENAALPEDQPFAPFNHKPFYPYEEH